MSKENNFIRLQVTLSGNERVVNAEVALKMIANALRSYEFVSGSVELFQDGEGRIYADGVLIHTPKGVKPKYYQTPEPEPDDMLQEMATELGAKISPVKDYR